MTAEHRSRMPPGQEEGEGQLCYSLAEPQPRAEFEL